MLTKTERLKAALEAARAIAAKAEDEGRDFTEEERATVTAKLDEARQLKADASLEKALSDFGDDVKAIDGGNGTGPAGAPAGPAGRTIGSAFTEDERIKAWLKAVAPNGAIPESTKGINSPAVGFPGLKGLGYRPSGGAKDTVTGASATSAGALVVPDYLGLQDEGLYARPLTLLDVITRGTTLSDAVEFVRVTTATNAAATVAEATDATGDTDGEKPESAIALEKVSAPVKTIAHWIPATKRALSDAAQVRTLIDNFLRYGLAEELEDQIVNGAGAGEDFIGILNTPNVLTQAFDTDLLTTVRKSKTQVKVSGRANANAFALHPNDAEAFDLLKDDQGRFYFGGPADDGIPRIWRMPTVETEAVPEGTGIVGDFRRAVIWDREQAGIMVSDSHADFFIRNLVAILAELRAAFGVIRPQAFCVVDLGAGS